MSFYVSMFVCLSASLSLSLSLFVPDYLCLSLCPSLCRHIIFFQSTYFSLSRSHSRARQNRSDTALSPNITLKKLFNTT